MELYSLEDPNKIKDINSTTLEYISAYENNKPKFKKVAVQTETSYHYPRVGFFEKCASNIIRHNERMNATKLLLVETCLNYDVLPKKKGDEIFAAYKDNIAKIPDGHITGVCGQTFPKYILCNNTQVLSLRKRPKLISLPDFTANSKEEKYARILLYYPLRPKQTIDTDRLGIYHFT